MKLRRSTIYYSILAIVLIAVAFSAFTSPVNVADAVLPEKFVNDVINKDLDWWLDDGYLDIQSVKKVVDDWKTDSSFDFTSLRPIVVAIVDTGIKADHAMFTGKYDVNGIPLTDRPDDETGKYDVLLRDDEGNAILHNAVKDSNDVTDKISNKHGTHVAGIVATLIHALDLEDYIKILPIKASSDTDHKFSSEAVSNAIEFALKNGADVINMSLAANGYKKEEFGLRGINAAKDKAILVAAAGNSAQDSAVEKFYPAAFNDVIGVMNYDETRNLYVNPKNDKEGSNYGDAYDICAPGAAIYSANGLNATYYKALTGTSMASPMVSFGAALVTLKHRAIENKMLKNKEDVTPINAQELSKFVREASSSSITKDNKSYPVFDLKKLLGFEIKQFEAEIADANNSAVQKIEQVLDNVKAITIKFDTSKIPAEYSGSVEWFIRSKANDRQTASVASEIDEWVKIGDGIELEYTPDIKAGVFEIKSVWTPDDEFVNGILLRQVENIIEFTMNYVPLNANTVKTARLNVIKLNDALQEIDLTDCEKNVTYRISVDYPEIMHPINLNSVEWYVGNEKIGTAKTFTFTPTNSGSYIIKAKLNGFFTNSVTLTVPQPPAAESKVNHSLIVYTAIAVGAIFAVAIIIAVIIIARRRRADN